MKSKVNHLKDIHVMIGSERNAAWAEKAYCYQETNVCVPGEEAVRLAKEWVEENQK